MIKRIAVMIPAYNEEENIEQAVRGLFRAGIRRKDVYIINDASTDKTQDVLSQLEMQNVLVNAKNMGKAKSLSMLVEKFKLTKKYEWIAFLDADSIVDKNYFIEALRFAKKNPKAVLLVGQVKSIKYNWLTALRQLEYTWTHSVFKSAQSKLSVITVGPGCASIYKNSALERIELAVDVLAEDMDYTIQIHRGKFGKTVYEPKMIVYTHDPTNLKDYIKQISRWYTGFWQVIFRHKIPFKFKKIDWELGLLSLEGLFFFGVLVVSAPVIALKYPLGLLIWFSADIVVSFFIALFASIKNKRIDILRHSPLYSLIRYINIFIYFKAFIRVLFKMLFKRNTKDAWEKVSRYKIAP